MGAGSSILGADGEWGETSLGDMPESCVAAVLLYLDPPEICQVARLNRAFRGAASADCVWAVKLPANYRYLAALAAAADDEVRGDGDDNDKRFFLAATKKEIYARLCRPTLFDAGRKASVMTKLPFCYLVRSVGQINRCCSLRCPPARSRRRAAGRPPREDSCRRPPASGRAAARPVCSNNHGLPRSTRWSC